MEKQSQEVSVVRFAPRQIAHGESGAIDEAGQALVAMLREAAALSQENVDRAMTMAHRLSVQLRAAEDRIQQLESDVKHLEKRATHAEGWLQTIRTEVEETLLGSLESHRPQLPVH